MSDVGPDGVVQPRRCDIVGIYTGACPGCGNPIGGCDAMGLWHKMQPYRNNIPASGEAYIRARTAARVARGLPCTK